MRTIGLGSQGHTLIECEDEPGAGGACHKYRVCSVTDIKQPPTAFVSVQFQDGPVKEAGVNGAHQEDLLAIVINRLQYFQRGKYTCRENALALTYIEEAMYWLGARTATQVKRGVEGTHEK